MFILYSALSSPPLTTSPLESIITSTPPALMITQSGFALIIVSPTCIVASLSAFNS
ncbi:hypothetical protein P0Q23_02585 [Campylobacter jejuni]|uniref:hypothetical protein n=1 Tax=Campylobacter jejuni TaxID=197 RepID=UPI002DBB2542|nr:hypothetical protein [Campylobacter jejuni]MEC4213268.1 hypothetical protein [Campylobacter jejuni]